MPRSATLPPLFQKYKVGVLDKSLLEEFRFSKCDFNPPPPSKMRSWHFWADPRIRTLDFQSATLPPPHAKFEFLDMRASDFQTVLPYSPGNEKFAFLGRSLDQNLYSPPPAPMQSLVFLNRSSLQDIRFGHQDFKVPLYTSPLEMKRLLFWTDLDFRFSK